MAFWLAKFRYPSIHTYSGIQLRPDNPQGLTKNWSERSVYFKRTVFDGLGGTLAHNAANAAEIRIYITRTMSWMFGSHSVVQVDTANVASTSSLINLSSFNCRIACPREPIMSISIIQGMTLRHDDVAVSTSGPLARQYAHVRL